MHAVGEGLRQGGQELDDETAKALQTQKVQAMQILANVMKAESKQRKGNDAFKNGDYALAIQKYTQALGKLGNENLDTDSARATRLACLTNRAACALKSSPADLESCAEDCTEALKLDEGNVKALFRRGTAFAAMGMPVPAQVDLEAAAKLKPEDKGIQKALTNLNRES
jgi:tetratricopeptide (TPR) repeat protein